MILRAIVERELRQASRKNATYWTRISAAGVAFVVVCFLLVAVGEARAMEMAGRSIFYALFWLMLVNSVGMGLTQTGDCLSGEKREGTLGLLFLTDLRGLDVVLGKLAASSLNVFLVVFATLPMLALSLIYGGVTPAQVVAGALTILNALLFALAAGMLGSALFRKQQNSAGFGLFLVLVFTMVYPIGALIYTENALPELTRTEREAWYDTLVLASPTRNAIAVQTWGTKFAWGRFAVSGLVVQGLSWGMLLLAGRIVPHRWQDRPAGRKRSTLKEWWRDRVQGNAAQRRAHRERLLALNPIVWLSARDRWKPWYLSLVLAVVTVFWLWGWISLKRDWLEFGVSLMFMICWHGVLRLVLANEVTATLAKERTEGTLGMILGTRLSNHDIIQGVFTHARRVFLRPLVATVVLDVLLLLVSLRQSRPEHHLPFIWLVAILNLLFDCHTMVWVGLWRSLSCRKPVNAGGETFAYVVVTAPFLFVLLSVLWGLMMISGPSRPVLDEGAIILFWFFLSVSVNVFWLMLTQRIVKTRLREVALETLLPANPVPAWRRWIIGD
jgi:ABC-type transport system involved in multi-copper enzyme maturation permease subunit